MGSNMQSAFKIFMKQIIDYAGLFPPTQLSMDNAIRNHLEYQDGADEWMLSRFICPARRLHELEEHRDEIRSLSKPLKISFLGRGGKNAEEFFTELEDDLKLADQFVENNTGIVTVDAYEVRLPEGLIEESNPVRVSEFLNKAAEIIESKYGGELVPFYEGAFRGEWTKTVDALAEGISYHNIYVQSKQFGKYRPAGYKLRCGGAEPSMYPSSQQIAHVILTCKRHEIALKATAGLHHPVRHFNETEQVRMHGFLNVFGAGIIAQYQDLNVDQIAEIIEDENSEHFIFTDSEFRWNDLSVIIDDLSTARSQRMISFGSCSFDEPREDLRTLGLI
jgi:hypothetical protein